MGGRERRGLGLGGGEGEENDRPLSRDDPSLTLRVYELSSQPVTTPTAKVTVSVAATLPASCMAAARDRSTAAATSGERRKPRVAAVDGVVKRGGCVIERVRARRQVGGLVVGRVVVVWRRRVVRDGDSVSRRWRQQGGGG
jgi:hypothetical protein